MIIGNLVRRNPKNIPILTFENKLMRGRKFEVSIASTFNELERLREIFLM